MTTRLALDPTLTLAFAMHHTKGAYALLVGSGVSRAAGIPTGWEVIQDLARMCAGDVLAGTLAAAEERAYLHALEHTGGTLITMPWARR